MKLQQWCLLLILAFWIGPVCAGRPYSATELVSLEGLGEGRLSPDGSLFVFERKLPLSSAGRLGSMQLFAFSTDAVQTIRPLFAARENASYYIGHFSPDGRHLSYRRRSQGEYVTGVYDLRSGRTIEFDVNVDDHAYQYPWISNTQLITRTSPPGTLSSGVERFAERLDRQAQAWKKGRAGQEDTSSPIGSGRYRHIDARQPGQPGLAVLDLATGAVRPLAQGIFGISTASADGTLLATVREVTTTLDSGARLEQSAGVLRRLVLFDLRTGEPTEVPEAPSLVRYSAPVWTQDGRTLVFAAYASGDRTGLTVEFWRYDRVSRKLRKAHPDDFVVVSAPTRNSTSIHLPRAAWLGQDLLILGYPSASGPAKTGWYRFRAGQPARNLTERFGAASVEVLGVASDRLIALSDGEVWTVARNGERTLLTGDERNPVRLWMDDITEGYTPLPSVVVSTLRKVALETLPTVDGEARGVFELDPLGGHRSPMVMAPGAAKILSALPASGRLVYEAEDDGTLVLRLSKVDGGQTALELNGTLREVERARIVEIPHAGAEGESISSFLVLPPNYRPGRRYPTIVNIYPGTVYRSATPRVPLNAMSFDNRQVWAAYDYAYFSVSVPMSKAVPRDIAAGLADKVLTAVNAAVAAGYVDPERLALQGHSFGGWGTLIALSQTDRFKAAVAAAAPTNYASFYGTFDTPNRMSTVGASPGIQQWATVQSGQAGMGAPPWVDPQRYLRNSPLFQVEKINTPVMLIQGDLDYVSITEGEQMFTALNHLNKDALFVRYWGEWHAVSSAANIRDVFARRLAWYDEHLDVRRDETGRMLWEDSGRAAGRAGASIRDRDWYLGVDRKRAEASSR